VDPVVLELCRLRVAQLLGCTPELATRTPEAVAAGLSEEQVEQLAAWPSAPCFDAPQRAALAFAEQFVIDPHGIAGPIRDELRAHFALPDVVALTEALALFDGFQRLQLVLGVD
jgi:AhpD family alkylhydroperoxidase